MNNIIVASLQIYDSIQTERKNVFGDFMTETVEEEITQTTTWIGLMESKNTLQ